MRLTLETGHPDPDGAEPALAARLWPAVGAPRALQAFSAICALSAAGLSAFGLFWADALHRVP